MFLWHQWLSIINTALLSSYNCWSYCLIVTQFVYLWTCEAELHIQHAANAFWWIECTWGTEAFFPLPFPRQWFWVKLQIHVLPFHIYRTLEIALQNQRKKPLWSLKPHWNGAKDTWKEKSRYLEHTCHIWKLSGTTQTPLCMLGWSFLIYIKKRQGLTRCFAFFVFV